MEYTTVTAAAKRIKFVIGEVVKVRVIAERVQYYGPDGKLITESLKDYTRKTVRKDYDPSTISQQWDKAERKKPLSLRAGRAWRHCWNPCRRQWAKTLMPSTLSAM